MTGANEFEDGVGVGSKNDSGSIKMLKRKNEDWHEGELEAEIKRVALDDDEEDQEMKLEDKDKENANGGRDDAFDADGKKRESIGKDEKENKLDGDHSLDKYNSENHIHLRILCLIREASLVVGHKGDRISKIKKITSTKINVSENIKDTPERVIHIRGDYDNVAKAINLIVKSMTNRFDEDIENLENSSGSNEKQPEIPTTLYFLISHFLMGYIIGKSGKKLKEIEDLSSIKLFASPQQLLPSNDRILAITGVSDSLEVAILNISKTILNNSNNNNNKKFNNRAIFYQPNPMYSVLVNNYSKLNFPMNLNMDMGMNGNMNLGMNVHPSMNMNPGMGMNMEINSGYNHQQHHQYHPTDKYTSYRKNKRTLPLRPVNNSQYARNKNDFTKNIVYTSANVANAIAFTPNFAIPNVKMIDPQLFNSQQLPMSIVTQEIYIDEEYVGNIIGKDGRHISSIKESTGCSIIIDSQIEGSSERKLIIKGTSMASQAAVMLISNKIETDKMNKRTR